MICATILILRPVVAKIVRGVSLKDSQRTNSARVVEKPIAIPPGKYPASLFDEGARVIHLQSGLTYEKFRAFVDDFDSLLRAGSIQILQED